MAKKIYIIRRIIFFIEMKFNEHIKIFFKRQWLQINFINKKYLSNNIVFEEFYTPILLVILKKNNYFIFYNNMSIRKILGIHEMIEKKCI